MYAQQICSSAQSLHSTLWTAKYPRYLQDSEDDDRTAHADLSLLLAHIALDSLSQCFGSDFVLVPRD